MSNLVNKVIDGDVIESSSLDKLIKKRDLINSTLFKLNSDVKNLNNQVYSLQLELYEVQRDIKDLYNFHPIRIERFRAGNALNKNFVKLWLHEFIVFFYTYY